MVCIWTISNVNLFDMGLFKKLFCSPRTRTLRSAYLNVVLYIDRRDGGYNYYCGLDGRNIRLQELDENIIDGIVQRLVDEFNLYDGKIKGLNVYNLAMLPASYLEDEPRYTTHVVCYEERLPYHRLDIRFRREFIDDNLSGRY